MVADALLIGTFVLLFNQPQLVPLFQTMSGGVVCIVAGLLLCGIGSYYYMDAGFGCGPRDALMVAICRHFPQVPAGVARFFSGRQRILYILSHQEPDSEFEVDILETILNGAEHCRFRITKK